MTHEIRHVGMIVGEMVVGVIVKVEENGKHVAPLGWKHLLIIEWTTIEDIAFHFIVHKIFNFVVIGFEDIHFLLVSLSVTAQEIGKDDVGNIETLREDHGKVVDTEGNGLVEGIGFAFIPARRRIIHGAHGNGLGLLVLLIQTSDR